jgi:hypothetical protein
MKKKLLLFTASLISISSAFAQCTITPSCTPSTTSGYCTQPLSGTALPAGMVGSNYNTVIQVSLGTTALDGAVSITGAFIESATLPAGLTYSPNPGSGNLGGGMNGCIEISGIPTEQWVGFNVSFEYTVLTNQGEFPQTINYTMNIDASTVSLVENKNDIFALFPNPTSDFLSIQLEEPSRLAIMNALGQTLQVLNIEKQATIDVREFERGIYFVKDLDTMKSVKFIRQ